MRGKQPSAALREVFSHSVYVSSVLSHTHSLMYACALLTPLTFIIPLLRVLLVPVGHMDMKK